MSKLKDLITRALRAQQEYLSKYRAGHTTLGCRITHMIGIPMIMASVLAFILYVLPSLDLIAVVIEVAFTQHTLQQFVWCFTIVLPMVLSDVLATPSAMVHLIAAVSLFTIGWFLQFIGHLVFEKNSPLFLSNPFNPLSYSTAVIFVAEEFGQLITRPFRSLLKK